MQKLDYFLLNVSLANILFAKANLMLKNTQTVFSNTKIKLKTKKHNKNKIKQKTHKNKQQPKNKTKTTTTTKRNKSHVLECDSRWKSALCTLSFVDRRDPDTDPGANGRRGRNAAIKLKTKTSGSHTIVPFLPPPSYTLHHKSGTGIDQEFIH